MSLGLRERERENDVRLFADVCEWQDGDDVRIYTAKNTSIIEIPLYHVFPLLEKYSKLSTSNLRVRVYFIPFLHKIYIYIHINGYSKCTAFRL